MKLEDIEFSVCRGDLKPGDHIVVTCDRVLHHEQRVQVTELLRRFFQDKAPVMVLGGGMKLAIVNADAAKHFPSAG